MTWGSQRHFVGELLHCSYRSLSLSFTHRQIGHVMRQFQVQLLLRLVLDLVVRFLLPVSCVFQLPAPLVAATVLLQLFIRSQLLRPTCSRNMSGAEKQANESAEFALLLIFTTCVRV